MISHIRLRGYLRHTFKNGMQYNITTTAYKNCIGSENLKPEGWENAKPYDSIPGPRALPIIGNMWLFFPVVGLLYNANLGDVNDRLYKKYGKILRLGSLLPNDCVFVYDPRDIETVFRNEGIYPIREGASKTIAYYRNTLRKDVFQGVGGMLTVHGKDWHDIRSKVNPILMQPQTILQYIDGIDLITNALVKKIKRFAKTDVNREMPDDFLNTIYSWTLESSASIALDKRLGCLDEELENTEALKIIRYVILSFELYEKLEFQPSFRNIYNTKKWKQFVEIEDFLTYTFVKYLKEAEAKIDQGQSTGKSVLQKLLKVDRKVAVATAMDVVFAGVDTTGKQTASVLYYLAKNQEVQDSLRKQLMSLMPEKDTPITKEILSQSPYLKAVIKETERLAPISSGNLRKSVKDMVLSGYQIPKGTNVITCNGLASKLEENYARPLEFLPERWLRNTTGELSHKNTNPFVTLPFGFGPRSCVGKRIANLEMEIGIAKIIRNFCVKWHQKDPTFKGAPFIGIADPLKFQFNELES